MDQLADAKIESGDLIAAVQADAVAWENVIELGAILAGKADGRVSDEQITLFESQGLAIEDLVAARRVYDLATKQGIGTEIPLFTSGGESLAERLDSPGGCGAPTLFLGRDL